MPEQVSFNINELTQGTVGGTGVFDVLMQAVKAHLKGEFEAGRIRGTDYANAYTMSVGQVLAQASQYATQRAKLEAELKLLDAQLARTAAESMNLIKQGSILDSQLCKSEAEIARINIETTYKVPEEVKAIRKQTMLTQVQTDQVKAQTQGISVDNNMKEFQMEFVLPKELDIKESQLSISMKEILLKEKQIEISAYELLHKLPADVALVTAQDELYTQKSVTEKAQVDNTVVGTGSVIDLSNKLLGEQANAYVVNANQTAAKLMIDTWVVRHTADPEGNLETDEGLRLTNADIGLAVAKIL